jgi:hypothetical protein
MVLRCKHAVVLGQCRFGCTEAVKQTRKLFTSANASAMGHRGGSQRSSAKTSAMRRNARVRWERVRKAKGDLSLDE